jgi:hypothetical protein
MFGYQLERLIKEKFRLYNLIYMNPKFVESEGVDCSHLAYDRMQ